MAAGKRSGSGSRRLDVATLLGLLLALAGIVGGFLAEHGKVSDIIKPTPALIVFGGTLGAVLVGTPMCVARRAFGRLKEILLEKPEDPAGLIDTVMGYATQARKAGLVSLDSELETIRDPFLRKALTLAVDGADLQVIRSTMELEIHVGEQELEREAKVFESAGGYAPTIGIIGAVLGLIQVMKDVTDPSKVGPGIAVAFVATIYGVGSANVMFLPAAAKIKARGHWDTQRKELLLEGVTAIVEGLNPKLIRSKLQGFLVHAPPAARVARQKTPQESPAQA